MKVGIGKAPARAEWQERWDGGCLLAVRRAYWTWIDLSLGTVSLHCPLSSVPSSLPVQDPSLQCRIRLVHAEPSGRGFT